MIKPEVRKKHSIELITENDLCISCGACRHACARGVISLEINHKKGFYEPVISDMGKCLECRDSACLSVCPSFEEDFISLADWTDESMRIGPYAGIYTGWNTSQQVRKSASSGGIIKGLAGYFLGQGLAEGVITLRHCGGLDYEPDVYRTSEEILQTPGSIYHNITFERAIELLKETPGKFVLIATPCQLTSIRKWQVKFPGKTAGNIVMTIGLVCGWTFSRHSLLHFTRSQGLDYKALHRVSYRGGDSVGSLVLDTGPETHTYSRRPLFLTDSYAVPYWVAFSRIYNNKRCLLCVEHLNYLADIVVGDAWLKRYECDQFGTSIIISRNAGADAVLRELQSKGQISLSPASEEDVLESQSADLALGISAQQLINRLRQKGAFVPRYILPSPVLDLPTASAWRKNYLTPSFSLFMARYNLGYTWFLLQTLIRSTRLFIAHSFMFLKKAVGCPNNKRSS